MAALATLKRRAEFQRVRGGGRWSTPAFVMEGKARAGAALVQCLQDKLGQQAKRAHDAAGLAPGPRFGFTITKKIGNSVTRSRIRRRLKAAIVATSQRSARSDFDYVVIAREPAFDRAFEVLVADFETAFEKVNAGQGIDRKANAARNRTVTSARGRATSPAGPAREKPGR